MVPTNRKKNLLEFKNGHSLQGYIFEKSNPTSVIGHISLSPILRGPAQFSFLGYGISLNKQNQGYMTEILEQTIQFAFNDLHLHRIMANHVPDNERSSRLLKRLGFTVEGYAKEHLHLNGQWQDHVLTALINPKWENMPIPN